MGAEILNLFQLFRGTALEALEPGPAPKAPDQPAVGPGRGFCTKGLLHLKGAKPLGAKG